MHYLLIIERAPGNLSAYLPDVPGCTTAGHTFEEVRANALEALSLHFEDGEPLPQARSLQAILAEGDVELDGTETLTWVDFEQEAHHLATA
jgi:predicted RNase H-like HicB family nuclease